MLEQYALRAAGLVYRALGFPPQFFTVLFAVPRIVGYVSHWRESLVDPDVKIMRPQQDYRVRAAHALPFWTVTFVSTACLHCLFARNTACHIIIRSARYRPE